MASHYWAKSSLFATRKVAPSPFCFSNLGRNILHRAFLCFQVIKKGLLKGLHTSCSPLETRRCKQGESPWRNVRTKIDHATVKTIAISTAKTIFGLHPGPIFDLQWAESFQNFRCQLVQFCWWVHNFWHSFRSRTKNTFLQQFVRSPKAFQALQDQVTRLKPLAF